MLLFFLVIIGFILFASFNSRITSRDTLRFLLSSSISLILLLIILGILAGMGQGITIVVNLFWDLPNLLLTIFTIHFLALIISHFPEYFFVALEGQEQKVKWHKSKNGLVYYSGYVEDKESGVYMKFFRRELGVLTYVIWLFILLTVFKSAYHSVNINLVSVIGCALLVAFHYYVESQQKDISKLKKSEKEKQIPRIKHFLRLFQFMFWLHLFLIILLMWVVGLNEMTEWNLLFLIIVTYQGAFLYILFRVFRGWFHYFSSAKKDKDDIDLYIKSFLPFYKFKGTVPYLTAMQVGGMFFVGLVLFLILLPGMNINGLNPIPVFVIILILYYSAVVILLKHYFYHDQAYQHEIEKGGKRWTGNRRKALLLSFAPLFFLAYVFWGTVQKNDLHLLNVVDESNTVDVKEFIGNLKDTADYKSHFIIGAYGGGLKANAWTLLTLRALEKEIGREFIESTLCMSGVSGGALGLGNYTMISRYNMPDDDVNWHRLIDTIGDANILSSDVSGWLLKDLVRDPLPLKYGGKDRARESMTNYQRMIGDTNGHSESFRSYWSQTYRNNQNSFPAILINTTPTKSWYGLACSVEGMNKFPIMIDILDHKGAQSLSFLSTVSTSNRFPLFSPAAEITNRGHFVDGGYFDNSGLLNARSFYEQLSSHSEFNEFRRDSVYAINIMNDRANYILSNPKIRRLLNVPYPEQSSSSELSAIVGGIAALERMPNYVREEIRNDPNMHLLTIEMPHRYTLQNIASVFRTTDLSEEEFQDIIDENNQKIDDALACYEPYRKEWGVVEPPLGRLISKPALEYQRAMLTCHVDVIEKIAAIKNKLR